MACRFPRGAGIQGERERRCGFGRGVRLPIRVMGIKRLCASKHTPPRPCGIGPPPGRRSAACLGSQRHSEIRPCRAARRDARQRGSLHPTRHPAAAAAARLPVEPVEVCKGVLCQRPHQARHRPFVSITVHGGGEGHGDGRARRILLKPGPRPQPRRWFRAQRKTRHPSEAEAGP